MQNLIREYEKLKTGSGRICKQTNNTNCTGSKGGIYAKILFYNSLSLPIQIQHKIMQHAIINVNDVLENSLHVNLFISFFD